MAAHHTPIDRPRRRLRKFVGATKVHNPPDGRADGQEGRRCRVAREGLEVTTMGRWLAAGSVLALAGAACGSSNKTTENGGIDGGGGSQTGGARG